MSYSDASDIAVAVNILQEFLNEATEVEEISLAFASCKYANSQIKWSTIKKEAYTILFGFKTCDYSLNGFSYSCIY